MVWEITLEELLERYADGERNFAGIDLINLRFAHFQGGSSDCGPRRV